MMRLPRCSPLAAARVAASRLPKSIVPFRSTIRGTMITAAFASATAAAVSTVAVSLPEATADATASSRPGSSVMCDRPLLTAATTSGRTSQPMTRMPLRANWAARGRPILPSPTTATLETPGLESGDGNSCSIAGRCWGLAALRLAAGELVAVCRHQRSHVCVETVMTLYPFATGTRQPGHGGGISLQLPDGGDDVGSVRHVHDRRRVIRKQSGVESHEHHPTGRHRFELRQPGDALPHLADDRVE